MRIFVWICVAVLLPASVFAMTREGPIADWGLVLGAAVLVLPLVVES